ncbi:hypothetical protein TSMG0109 [Halocynthia phage JM-2012]|uniref:hypothetical protein n=1 Tax=Halocynthia phage JM-2012 TaxID=1173297 RepID=UPI00025C6941|nr:hypothetical protein TSMG0109 [Halocynthia phage JM-2012]AFI55392.1 hypothetical protein TSMG0109 [Halocynthia phage JM-2012]
MRVGISIDDGEYDIGIGALLEQLASTNGFNPTLDVPYCLEYFDFYQIENAKQDLVTDVFYQVVHGSIPNHTNEPVLESAIVAVADVIIMSCENMKLDKSKLQGIDIIVSEICSRIVIWFNKEDVEWIQVN